MPDVAYLLHALGMTRDVGPYRSGSGSLTA